MMFTKTGFHSLQNTTLVWFVSKQSNIGALDIDYADDDLIQAILEMLPKGYDKWTRIGAKGMVFAFRFNPKVPRAFKVIDKQKVLWLSIFVLVSKLCCHHLFTQILVVLTRLTQTFGK